MLYKWDFQYYSHEKFLFLRFDHSLLLLCIHCETPNYINRCCYALGNSGFCLIETRGEYRIERGVDYD